MCCTWMCFVQTVIVGFLLYRWMGWTDEWKQAALLACCLKISKHWQLNPQIHPWLQYIVTGVGMHTCTEAFRPSVMRAYNGNAIHHAVSALVSNPVRVWPLAAPRWSPADSDDWRGPICFVSARYAFTTTTWDILSLHIHVSWLKASPHREAETVSRLCGGTWVDLSVFQKLCIKYTSES